MFYINIAIYSQVLLLLLTTMLVHDLCSQMHYLRVGDQAKGVEFLFILS